MLRTDCCISICTFQIYIYILLPQGAVRVMLCCYQEVALSERDYHAVVAEAPGLTVSTLRVICGDYRRFDEMRITQSQMSKDRLSRSAVLNV
jgi:hypothetical protein